MLRLQGVGVERSLHCERLRHIVYRSHKPFFEWLYSPCGPWPLFSFLIYSQSVGLLGRVNSSSQGLYLNTGQHKHTINTYAHNIHALSEIRTHDHSVPESEDSSCLRPLGYRGRPSPFWET
jgi:hypothetical protein